MSCLSDTQILEAFIACLLDGDVEASVCKARQMLDSGVPQELIVTRGIETAMERLDAKCLMDQFNLLEIMLAGRAVMAVMNSICPQNIQPMESKGKVVLAALEGDVHDLGKNIVKMVLTANRYQVIDCGKDCPLPQLIDTVVRIQPAAVGISGLISTCVPIVRRIRSELSRIREIPESLKIIAGGSSLKQLSAEDLNVDFVSQNVFDGLNYLHQLTGRKKS